MHSQIATTADPCPLDLASSLNFNRAAPPEHLPPNTNQPRKNGTSLFPSSLPDSAQTNIFSTTTSRPTNSAPNKSSSAYKPSTSARATRTRPRGSGRPTSTATPRPASSATRPCSATWPSPRTSPWPRSALSSSARWSSPWARRRRARTRLSLRLGRGQRLGGRVEDGTGAMKTKCGTRMERFVLRCTPVIFSSFAAADERAHGGGDAQHRTTAPRWPAWGH